MAIEIKNFKLQDFKSFASLISGNILAKIILALSAFFLAQIYGSSKFGIFNVFVSYISLFPILTSFNLENIIILQKGSKETRNLFNVTIYISLIASFFLTLIFLVLQHFGALNTNQSYLFFVMIGIGGLLSSWNYIQNSFFTKHKLFKQISISLLLASLSASIFQFTFHFLGFSETGLVYGWILSLLISFIYGLYISKYSLKPFDIKLFRNNIKEHLDVLKYSYPSDTINTIANNLLPILTLVYFTASDVGVYALAIKIITLPLMFLTSAISKIYFQKSIKLNQTSKKALYNLTITITKVSLAVVFMYVIAINSIGPYFLGKLYKSSEWEQLNTYLLYLSPWILARSMVNPISTILFVLKKNHYSLIFNIFLLFINFLALYVGWIYHNYSYCIFIFSVLSGIGYLFLYGKIFLNLRANATE